MIQQSTSMQIFLIIFILIFVNRITYSLNSSCLSCSSNLCYQCYNTLPIDRTHIEKLSIICNTTKNLFQPQERFYSIIQSFTIINCTMKTLYLDQYTHWNYLEHIKIIHANLTSISSIIFNRSLSMTLPILYSVKTLNLSYNSIRIINKSFSYYFPSLIKLDLSYNHLILIKKKTFINLIYLKELYLNNNYLKQILPNIFPRQSLYFINLNKNAWYCSCTNVLTLSISQPIPICYTPKEFQNQNASDVARQCFLRTKANILITTNRNQKQNLTCIISSIIDGWKNKINKNITLISIWHIEQRRSISYNSLSTLSNKSNEYLICFNFSATHPESIDTIITLPIINVTKSIIVNSSFMFTTIKTTTTSVTRPLANKLSPFFLWLLNTSKNILPKYFRTSDKHILIVWLILVTIALIIFIFLIYFIHQHKTIDHYHYTKSYSLIPFDKNSPHHRTLFNVKFTCKNHKCLCQYNRRARSTLNLTKSKSSTLLNKQIYSIHPSFIEPSQLRYAKIKRILSTKEMNNDCSTGEFRTIIKLKSLPS
ncbi:unnamed protein product [Adineta steineri]|uniref:Uncharacterized protein n=1 Tax=Adineta steineri TaxID=433720 RepID=A0A819EC36_9BILA|nr:unnamed protein product [Adineta steineri]CAF3848218.1 unnamed protein product [Adineta steineri]